MMTPSVFLGDFAVERTVLLGVVPQDSPDGAQMRTFHLLVGETLAPDQNNFWIAQLGKLDTGTFERMSAPVSFQSGIVAQRLRSIPFLDPILLSRGDALALRVTPQGMPPPLVGLSVVPEYGIVASRRTARV